MQNQYYNFSENKTKNSYTMHLLCIITELLMKEEIIRHLLLLLLLTYVKYEAKTRFVPEEH